MKFVFDYEETLIRRITIDANNLGEAIDEIERRIETEQIVLGAEDFAGGQITMPLEANSMPRLQNCGEDVKDREDFDILIDMW